ncbi:hypothetical protein PR202_ga20336 [Eleusine coracana subsp. coracana]|uniref:F-box domain-containing protein n=1 Tax=Eleusine coracana subsp. coracana TaxID=191504 RepID=A0AAV5CXT6_ELECO|nr:hypothetical protein PR202_ga20336 [Eleusine coracana subsp. coracana]
MSSTSPRAPPELIPDAVTEVLLCVPPDDPARLVRAAAVCRLWHRILAGPAFRSRYCELHGGRRHVLGFLHNPAERRLPRFVPTGSFRPAAADQRNWYAL